MFIVLAISVLFRKITKGLLTQNGFNCYITSATGRVFHIMYISPNLFTSHIKLYFHPGPCFVRLLSESLLLSCVAEKFDSFRFPSVPFPFARRRVRRPNGVRNRNSLPFKASAQRIPKKVKFES